MIFWDVLFYFARCFHLGMRLCFIDYNMPCYSHFPLFKKKNYGKVMLHSWLIIKQKRTSFRFFWSNHKQFLKSQQRECPMCFFPFFFDSMSWKGWKKHLKKKMTETFDIFKQIWKLSSHRISSLRRYSYNLKS